ncbi:MAG: hypothetical protein V3R86_03335 [Candidatus Hydrothermarchaeaceae archaeon]
MVDLRVRCIKSLAPNAGKRLKFPSSRTVKDPFTAGTVSQSEDQLDFKIQKISS